MSTALRTRDRRDALDAFLSAASMNVDGILAEVESVYGEPEAIIATGSIVAGFGTPESDVDVIVLVDHDDLSDLPIMSYPGSIKVDIEYLGRSDLLRQFEFVLREDWPYARGCSEDDWREYYRALRTLTRLEHACVLSANREWAERFAELSGVRFRERVVRWWASEAVRIRFGAGLLKDTQPLLACVRLQDALLAALSARAAQAGEYIMSKKWLAEKLRNAGDDEGISLLRRVLSTDMHAVGEWMFGKLASMLETLLPSVRNSDMTLELRAAKGLQIIDLRDEVLFSRWGMRGVVFAGRLKAILPANFDGELYWRGHAQELPPPEILELFRQDMLWLGVSSSSVLQREKVSR